VLDQPTPPLAHHLATLTAELRAEASRAAAEAGLIAALHALILASLAQLLARLADIIASGTPVNCRNPPNPSSILEITQAPNRAMPPATRHGLPPPDAQSPHSPHSRSPAPAHSPPGYAPGSIPATRTHCAPPPSNQHLKHHASNCAANPGRTPPARAPCPRKKHAADNALRHAQFVTI